ncbi:sulfur carrier protein ThiS [Mesoterricola sediminis]|uniref:Thiamine biosynthesis protein ThiS n=1 Tax=Mesoterricola sediminis TaxID=2927980 RepID=A0AA48KBJ7_9BACT|nr:sulfur carrier protein ThiS [Mesoterricola sediminis]BDU75155.1 thiamine biosynthesis protein ThiS [Mesoterricola sediminis]
MITVNGDRLDWTEGMTIRDVLRVRNYKFPLLVIKVDDALVQPRAYDTTTVPDGAVVSVVHLLSGG